jgi:hypothetical protein
MPAPAVTTDLLLAEWVLGRLAPEDVPDLAVAALQHGCGSAAVAALAGLQRPTRSEVEEEIPRLLCDLGVSRQSKPEALKRLVDTCAHQIAIGEVEPLAGAERIVTLWSSNFEPDSHLLTWLDIRPFSAVTGSETAAQSIGSTATSVVEHATDLLQRGGLNVGERFAPGQLAGRRLAGCGVQEHSLKGQTTAVRLGLEFEDGLRLSFGIAPDGHSPQVGLRALYAHDLGEDGMVEVRREGFPCDVLTPGTPVHDVRALVDAREALTIGATIELVGSAVFAYVCDETLLITSELPDGARIA